MKRKWAAITLAVALAVGVAVIPTPAEANSKKDRMYVTLVKSHSELAHYGSEKQLIRMGKNVCKTFDSGVSLRTLVAAMQPSLTNRDSEDLFAATVAAAVVVYCPKHEKKLS
jgi:hypothetical protein